MSDAQSFWDREIVEARHVSWLEDLQVRLYVNELIGGGVRAWPLDWFEQWLQGRRFGRGLSVGCGGGALERDVIRRGLCRRIDAFDGSLSSLRVAATAAATEGMKDQIRYFAADFNEPALPKASYDIVFFHQSAHHVANLERLLRAILRALKPGGLVYLDEYIGPSRFEWSEKLLDGHRSAYSRLPAEVRTVDPLPVPIQVDDPSEAFRSSEIENQLKIGFRTLARRPYGGTLLSVIYPTLRREQITPVIIADLITEEQRWLSSGEPSYYAVIVVVARGGLGRALALALYWTAPKVKRLVRELAMRLRRRRTGVGEGTVS